MAATAVSFFVLFSLIFHPVFLHPIEPGDDLSEYCPPPFKCDEEHQYIQLDKWSGKLYQVENITTSTEVELGDFIIINATDTELQQSLNSRACSSFYNSIFLLENAEYIPYPITLYRCIKAANTPSYSFYYSYTGCSDFIIFHQKDVNFIPLPSPPIINCSTIHLPGNISNVSQNQDIFEMLTASFSLKVPVRHLLGPPCEECEDNEGKCKLNTTSKIWQCVSANGTTTAHSPGLRRGLLIGFGCFAVLIILVIIAFFWHRRNKKGDSSNLLRSNTYSGDFSKSNLEGANLYYGFSVFTYDQLEEATYNFASENELGDGGFGTVYYGKLQDGREVAVKRLHERNYKKVNQFLNEIDILTRLRHQNLVSLYGCTSRRSRELLLVYEYIPNGTVADHLHGDRAISSPLSWPVRMRIAIETANALVYLHASGIIHRDVKTNNILLDNNFCVKVADFGISRLFPNDVTHISTAPQGTPGYVDPEYYQCYQLTEKSDVYSLGVVLVELISSMPAVDITRDREEINLADLAINKIQNCALDDFLDPSLGYQTDDEIKRMTTLVAELAFLCLQQDKETRPSMEEVLEELKRIENGECESDVVDDDEEQDLTWTLKITEPLESPDIVSEK